MLKQRLVTVALVLPMFLALLFYAPSSLWGVALAVFMAFASQEWGRLWRLSPVLGATFVGLVLLSCLLLQMFSLILASDHYKSAILFPICLVAVLFWLLFVPSLLRFRWPLTGGAWSFVLGWLILVPTWVAAYALQPTPLLLLSVLLAVWIADTAAYFSGRLFGRRKLAPEISPGKTIEGVIGACIAVLLYAVLALRLWLPEAGLTVYGAILAFAFVFTLLSVEGDLFESWWKRKAGVKDSGDVLPGHGGILDRIDSVTATLPFAVLFLAGALA